MNTPGQHQITIVRMKTLALVLPFLGDLSHQIPTKSKKVLKGTINCWKLNFVFFNTRIIYLAARCLVWSINLSIVNGTLTNGGETDRHLKARSE